MHMKYSVVAVSFQRTELETVFGDADHIRFDQNGQSHPCLGKPPYIRLIAKQQRNLIGVHPLLFVDIIKYLFKVVMHVFPRIADLRNVFNALNLLISMDIIKIQVYILGHIMSNVWKLGLLSG